MATRVRAPAKINLSLHVTGQRADGYHLLDSLVAFAPARDELRIDDATYLSLSVDGPEAAGVPSDASNLVLRAAEMFANGRGAAITLTKCLPAASGIGGGSADAAAAVRGLLSHWGEVVDWDDPDQADEIAQTLTALGADVPMCLSNRAARVQGIGEQITRVSLPSPVPCLLINPRVEVSTPQVFKALASKSNPPMPDVIPTFDGVSSLVDWLSRQRNDLQAPAIQLAPEIGAVLDELQTAPECLLARMSGSGATCFGIFPTEQAREAAAKKLRQDHPNWWVATGDLGDQARLGAPELS